MCLVCCIGFPVCFFIALLRRVGKRESLLILVEFFAARECGGGDIPPDIWQVVIPQNRGDEFENRGQTSAPETFTKVFIASTVLDADEAPSWTEFLFDPLRP